MIPPRFMVRLTLPPSVGLASRVPIATPPPFSSGLASTTQTIQVPGVTDALQLS